MQQNLFQKFLSQEAEVSVNRIEKEPQKPPPKLKKIYIKYLLRIFALPAIHCK